MFRFFHCCPHNWLIHKLLAEGFIFWPFFRPFTRHFFVMPLKTVDLLYIWVCVCYFKVLMVFFFCHNFFLPSSETFQQTSNYFSNANIEFFDTINAAKMGVVRNILFSQYSEKVLQIAIFYSAPIFLHNKALSMPFHLSMNNETAQGHKCKWPWFWTIFTQKLCLRRSADTKYFMDMTQIETHISNHHSCSWQQIKNFTEAVVARVVL